MTGRTTTRRRTAVKSRKAEPVLCPRCGDLVIWVTYVSAKRRKDHLGRPYPLKKACLDWPEVVDDTSPEAHDQKAMSALGVTRAGIPQHLTLGWIPSCRHIDENGLLPRERGYSLHLVTHPDCKDLVVRATDGEPT